ncbi:MAG: DinB family protein [Flavobacteriales bacterium]
MKFNSEQLILELVELTRKNLNSAEKLMNKSLSELNQKPSNERWSALECVEHLNKYGRFYMPEIEMRISESTHSVEERFKSNWLGNYFSNFMKYKEKLNTMKTFPSMNPAGSQLTKAPISTFISQQQTTLELLDKARTVSLTRTKTSITISKWIKLRLGDTFRVVIYHNERHLIQALKAAE